MQIKRWLAMFLSVCLLISVVPVFVSAAENPFTDVPENKYYYQSVLWAVENGITTGKTSTTFAPNDPCTRKQIVTFLWRAAGEPAPKSMVNPFTDVKADRFEKAILWAYYEGITNGTTETTFSGDNTCTRKQIVTFLWRFMGQPKAQSSANPFTDVKADRFQNAILWAYYSGITTGTGDGSTFSPEDPCTRGQIVTFLYRAEEAATQPPSLPADPATDAGAIYAKCAPAVFTIESYYEDGNVYDSGFGFFIDSSGIAVVSIYVLKDDRGAAHSAVVRTADTGAEYPVSGVYDYSEEEGWAVIQVEGSGFPYLPIGDSDAVAKGDQVFAVGWYTHPGEDPRYNSSEYCVLNPSVEKNGRNLIDMYSTETGVIGYSEYGALVDQYGQVIGILTMINDGIMKQYGWPISIIENYSRENLRSFQEIKPGYRAFASAYTALTKWIEENYTAYEDGCYIYEESEDIYREVFNGLEIVSYYVPSRYRLRWSPSDDELTVTSTITEGTAIITATMNYTADKEDSLSSYAYTDTQDHSHDATITAWIPRDKYEEHYYHIVPDSYDGNEEDWDTHRIFNQSRLYESLDFTNRVFRYFSDFTIADLGFTAHRIAHSFNPEADTQANAWNTLTEWIFENYTAYENGEYIYEEWREGDGGRYREQICWEPYKFGFTVVSTWTDGSITISSTTDLVADGQNQVKTYYSYEDAQNDSLYTKANPKIDQALFDEDYVILFESYEGDPSGLTISRANHSSLLQSALDYTNKVFGYYSDYTVADLGFVAYQNEAGDPGKGAFADAYNALAEWIQANHTAYEDGYYIYAEQEESNAVVYQYLLYWAPGDDHITAISSKIDSGVTFTSVIEYTPDMEHSFTYYSCEDDINENGDAEATAYIKRDHVRYNTYKIRFDSYEGDVSYLESDRKNHRIMIGWSLAFTDRVFGYFSDYTVDDLGFGI